MKFHVFRLKPHEDLKQGILAFAKIHAIKAGCVVTCVGSLEHVHLRYARQENGLNQKGHFEIISLVGTFSEEYGHFHLSVADGAGKTTGGHLLDSNLVYTTAEIVVGEIPGTEFLREKDETHGYAELVVKKLNSGE